MEHGLEVPSSVVRYKFVMYYHIFIQVFNINLQKVIHYLLKCVHCGKMKYFLFFCIPNRTPSGMKMVTVSQVQNIGCRWQAISTH